MLQRRRLTARKRRLRALYAGLPLSKLQGGKSIDQEKADARAHRRAVIDATRVSVWIRSRGRCEFCGDTESETARKGEPKPQHEMNEVFLTRADGRRMEPERIFNLFNCARTCPPCHHEFHAGRLDVRANDPERGCDGGLTVTPRLDSRHTPRV